jgi:hypothetical protein
MCLARLAYVYIFLCNLLLSKYTVLSYQTNTPPIFTPKVQVRSLITDLMEAFLVVSSFLWTYYYPFRFSDCVDLVISSRLFDDRARSLPSRHFLLIGGKAN